MWWNEIKSFSRGVSKSYWPSSVFTDGRLISACLRTSAARLNYRNLLCHIDNDDDRLGSAITNIYLAKALSGWIAAWLASPMVSCTGWFNLIAGNYQSLPFEDLRIKESQMTYGHLNGNKWGPLIINNCEEREAGAKDRIEADPEEWQSFEMIWNAFPFIISPC